MKLKVSHVGDTRRLTLPTNSDYAALVDVLRETYDLSSLQIKYKDDEGDFVSLSNDEELKEAIRINSQGVLRFGVKIPQAPTPHHLAHHRQQLVLEWQPFILATFAFFIPHKILLLIIATLTVHPNSRLVLIRFFQRCSNFFDRPYHMYAPITYSPQMGSTFEAPSHLHPLNMRPKVDSHSYPRPHRVHPRARRPRTPPYMPPSMPLKPPKPAVA